MNRNILKWVLIAAVILGAAGYLILSETSSNSKKEQIVVGHSKPFKIEPVEGITPEAKHIIENNNALFKGKKSASFSFNAEINKLFANRRELEIHIG